MARSTREMLAERGYDMAEYGICELCAHWDSANMFRIPVYETTNGKPRLAGYKEMCPCRIQALEVDAPDSAVLTAAEGNCINESDSWEDSDAFWAAVRQDAKASAEIRETYDDLGEWLRTA